LDATFPALSLQLPLALTPLAGVSCVKVCDPVGEFGTTPEFATDDALSTQEYVTVTFWFVHVPAP
jgi:hypothetical protein